MNDNLVVCSQCNQEIIERKFYFIYKIIVITEEKEYEIGISRMLSEINDYIMKKYYHLSASEIMLLRPDVVVDYFREQYKEEIIEWRLQAEYVCYACYDIYKEIMPLI